MDFLKPSNRLFLVGCMTYLFGFLNVFLVMHEAIHKGNFKWSSLAIAGVDAAFCVSAMLTGLALILRRRWAEAGAVAVWGAVFVDSVYWSWVLGSFLLQNKDYLGYYLNSVPRLLFHLVTIPACPYVVWAVFMHPAEDRVSRRMLTGALVSGLLLCGIVNGIIVALD